MSKLSEIVDTVMSSLEDEDSYLYLSAVISLANISLHLPDNQVERILLLYCNTEQSLDDDCVSKLGESLTRFLIERGEMVFTHRNQFLNVLLNNCRVEKSYLVRTSSLSNLTLIGLLDFYSKFFNSREAIAAIIGDIKVFTTRRGVLRFYRILRLEEEHRDSIGFFSRKQVCS